MQPPRNSLLLKAGRPTDLVGTGADFPVVKFSAVLLLQQVGRCARKIFSAMSDTRALSCPRLQAATRRVNAAGLLYAS